MEIWQDVRYAVRRLIEARWFTMAAVAALSIGIGANAAVFTIVNAILLRGLPYEEPDRIVALWTENERGGQTGFSFPDYEDARDQTRSLASLAAVLNASVNLADEGNLPERIQGAYVTPNLFQMLGETPVLGRAFTEQDDAPGATPVVLVGYSVWQNRYGGAQSVLGQTVRVNSLVATIVGVMGPNMRFPNNTDLWIPRINLPPATNVELRNVRGNFQVIGRLASTATIEGAREEIQSLGRRLAEAHPDTNTGWTFNLMSFDERATGTEIRAVFGTLMGAVVFVLLIACANVANLLLAKSADRAREIAVRVSLGATRGRIVRQLLVESLIIALMAGVVGLALGIWGIDWFDGVTQNVGKPYWMVFSLDPIVFGYIAAVCLGTAVLFGLAPALHISRTDVNEVLKEGTRGGSSGKRSRRWAGALIIGEMALTLVLLSGAAFMMRSFLSMQRMETGIESDGLLAMQVYLPLTKYPQQPAQLEVLTGFLDRLEGLPGTRGIAISSALPVGGGGVTGVELDGRVTEEGVDPPTTTVVTVSDGYFDVMRLPVLQGRAFEREDGGSGFENLIVNQRFVDVHLQGGEVLGRQVRLTGLAGPNPDEGWFRVVGVTENVRQQALQEAETDPVVYLPLPANAGRQMNLIVGAEGDMADVTSLVRQTLREVEPDVPAYNIRTLEEHFAEQRWPFRVFGMMFSVFAGAALLLSAIGLYSITAHSVVQRIREFGIRISLGAEPKEISWLAARRILVQLAVGIPIGILGAYGVGKILESVLVQTTPGDPLTLAAIVIVLVGVALVACLLPARKASAVDPVTALRVE